MKIITNLKFYLILLCLLNPSFILSIQKKPDEQESASEVIPKPSDTSPVLSTGQATKYLFMYKYPVIMNEPLHKMNLFSYKNVQFSSDQIAFYESTNDSDVAPDESYDTTKYMYTMRYEYLDIPCLNRSHLCTHSQFLKEFKPLYPEINYSIPKAIIESLGDANKASEQCLLILLNPVLNVDEAAWLCHPDLKTILDLQISLSYTIYNANLIHYDFVTDYIEKGNTIVKAIMVLDKDKFTLNDMNKQLILTAEWKDVEPYSSSLYLKEELVWKGAKEQKPDTQRCLKFYRKSEIPTLNADFFCAIYHRNDVTMKLILTPVQARFAAEMYANKINIRLQMATVKAHLLELSKFKKGSLEVDSKLLFPLKIEIRRYYFIYRHAVINNLKLGLTKKEDLPNLLAVKKDKAIDKVCGGIEVCKNALNFCIDKDMVPLKGTREKFAMDCQNPYNHLMPKVNIQIDKINDGSLGKTILTAVAKMKGTQCYFAEQKESLVGEIPNSVALKKAFNTIEALREKKEYSTFDALKRSCQVNDKHSSKNIRRKISFLMFAGDNDVFFEYLGHIRDFQLTKK